MMISPEAFIEIHKNDSYEKLISERMSLERELRRLEKILFSKEKDEAEEIVCPSPEVQYKMTLEYLSEISSFMIERYDTIDEYEEEKRIEGLSMREILKDIMKRSGNTNASLAEKCGYATPSGVSTKLERAETIRIDTLLKLIDAMDYELVVRDKNGDKEWVISK